MSVFDLNRRVKELEQEKIDLQNKVDGVYEAYVTLRYYLENNPSHHDMQAAIIRINKLETLLTKHVEGWQFLLKGDDHGIQTGTMP